MRAHSTHNVLRLLASNPSTVVIFNTDLTTFQYIITVLGINCTIVTVIPQSSEFNGVSINATIELELSPGRY